MRIYKKSYALLLIALIATTSLQAAPMDTLNALLVRMQKNVILRQVTAKRVAAFVGVAAAGIGLWWWLKNRSGVQTQLTTQEKNVTTEWVVAQSKRIDSNRYAVKLGSRYDIFLVCHENHEPAQKQELDLLKFLVGESHTLGNKVMLPLVEFIANQLDKQSDVYNALAKAFIKTDQFLKNHFSHFEAQGAQATVAVIDKEKKKVFVAKLGGVQAAVLSGKVKIMSSLKLADLSGDEKNRVHQILSDYTCSRMSREEEVREIKDTMEKNKL